MENKYYFTLNMFAAKGSEENYSMYNPCDLQIIMKTGNEMPESTRYDFYLYDDTYTLMGYIQQKYRSDSYVIEKRKIDAIMNINFPWAEGKYTLLTNIITPAKGKDEPEKIKVIKVNFILMEGASPWEEDMKLHIESTEMCKGITPEMAMAQCLNHDAAPAWCSYSFHRLPGMMPLKHWIIRRKQWEMVDGLIGENKPNPMSYCNNYLVKAQSMTMMTQAVLHLKLSAFKNFKKYDINCERLYDELTPSDPYHRVKEMFSPRDASESLASTIMGFRMREDEFYFIHDIGILSTPKGEPILKALRWNLMCNSPRVVIFIVGTKKEVDDLFKVDPTLVNYFPVEGWYEVGQLSYSEILRYMYSWMKVENMNLSNVAEGILRFDIKRGYNSRLIENWTIDDMNRYIKNVLKPRYTNRVATAGIDVKNLLSQSDDVLVKVEDFDRSYFIGKEAADEILSRVESQDDDDTPKDEEENPQDEVASPSPSPLAETEEPSEEKEEDNDFEELLNSFLYKMGEDACSDADGDDPDKDDEDGDNEDSTFDYLDRDLDNDDEEEDDDGITHPFGFDSGIGDDEENDLMREPKVKFQVLSPLQNPREELNKLVGCLDIKQRIEQLTMLSRYNKMIKKVNPEGKGHELSLHSIFYGKPGTGKTTICKIMGSLLKKTGALSRGHVVVCSRKDFIGTRWGDEEKRVRQAIEEAQGGVLMIDEAYQLMSENPWDPGRLVIPLLMDILSDEKQRDIAIVLCGYKEEMKKLIDINPGLKSRFPNVFEFKDFTVEELLEITQRRVGEYGYEFTRAAWRKYRAIIEEAYHVRDANTWGNARFIANLLENIYLQHAIRCVKRSGIDKHHLLQITPADVQPIEIAKPKPRIGF